MGFWEPRKLEEVTAQARANTAIWKMPESGYLSGLLIKGSCATVSGATNTVDDWRMCDTITDLKIKGNESVPILDLDGELARAKAFWDTNGLMHLDKVRDYATNTQLYKQWLGLGRYPGDMIFGLDLSRFSSAKVELTNDVTSTNWGTPDYDVYGVFWRGINPPPFQGYIKSTRYRNWTTVQAETKYLDLPPSGLLRRILLQAVPTRSSGAASTGFGNLMYNIKYLANGGDTILYDDSMDTLVVLNHFMAGHPALDFGEAYRTDGEVFSHGIGSRIGGAHGAYSVGGSGSSTVPTLSDDTGFTMTVRSYDGDCKYNFIFPGYGPENSAILNHDLGKDGSEFLNLNEMGRVSLEIQTRDASSAASGTNRVVVEEVV